MYRDEWEGPTTEELLHEELRERAHEKEMERQRTLLELHHFYKDHAPSPTEEPTTRSAPVKKPEPESISELQKAIMAICFLISIVAVIIISFVGIIMSREQSRQKARLSAELQSLRSQNQQQAEDEEPVVEPRKRFSWEIATEPIETSEGLRGKTASTEKRIIILPASPTRRQGVVSTPGQP